MTQKSEGVQCAAILPYRLSGFSGMDMLFIDDLRVEAKVGVFPREKILPQNVLLNLKIGLPESAGKEDDLRRTIDYARVVEKLRETLAARQFNLLEALAECVAETLRADFSAPWVWVSAAKPGILPDVHRIGVEIERGEFIERI